MRYDDTLHRIFLDELRELETFRLGHAAAHPALPLDREDPDLRRLVEALAFFSARTHRAAVEGSASAHRRLFQQMLPYSVSPLPAMGLVTARPTGQFVEALDLPRGTEIAIRAGAGAGAPALFRTMADLRILPLAVTRVALVPLGPRLRLVLHAETPAPRRDEVGELSLHVNYLDGFESSLRLVRALRACARRTAVAWDEGAREDAAGTPCEVSFGLPLRRDEPRGHPIEEERRAFHFPEGELFLNVRVPRPPGSWRRLAIMMDLDASFPRELTLGRGDTFRPFTVPVMNLERAAARPFVFDGTAERVRIRHPDAAAGFALHSVAGVYRIDHGATTPLRPALARGGSGSFEVELAEDGADKGHWLHLDLPEAFEAPCTISVDALWHQPAFSRTLGERLQASLPRREIAGVRWDVDGPIRPAAESAAQRDTDALLHVLGLQKRSHLALEDLLSLLDVVGNAWSGRYGALRPLLAHVRVSESLPPRADARATLELTYHLGFRSLGTVKALAESFAEHARAMLDAWISGASVSVRLEEEALP